MKYLSNFFTKRLNRSNFWLGLLFIFLIYPVIMEILNPSLEKIGFYNSPIFMWFPLIFIILFILSISIRRLHDSGKKWSHILLLLVPFVNFLIPIWLVSTKSQVGENEYGEEDKGLSLKRLFGFYD